MKQILGKRIYSTLPKFVQACYISRVGIQSVILLGSTRSVNKVMRLIQYNSVFTFKLQIEFVRFKIVPLGGYTPPETLFPLFVATLVVANRNRF
jgi:apolipoprotein N-acyltransferase